MKEVAVKKYSLVFILILYASPVGILKEYQWYCLLGW